MKVFRFIVLGLFGVLGITGCGRKVVPVSSESTSITKTDSTTSSIKKDSSNTFFKETLTENKQPEASAEKQYTQSQWDSLVAGLNKMPPNTRIVYQNPDKKLRAQLQIYKDSIGNLHFKCTSLEQTYYEKNTELRIYNEKLVNELAEKNKIISSFEKTEVEKKKGLWQSITENIFARWMIYFILGGITIIIIGLFLKIVKKIPIVAFIKKLLS